MINLFQLAENIGFNSIFLNISIFISLFSGLLIITTKNPIISVLYLILLFISVCCYLSIVGLLFLALSYLLVYVGAVSILFLFILMLINIRVSELISNTSNSIPLGVLSTVIFFVAIGKIIPEKDNNFLEKESVYYVSSNSWDSTIVGVSDISSIGNIMYSSHSLWLIITSILILLAMVGSIIITLRQNQR